ncbi:OLC1v1016473C1 [Oldenlandia corymbosa var. corymbosa]|uniref:OLC1v1016473C1 n=1 Tax=Oldenlandia corymbosa var. corymbosa TaxID=529605 RepID=A0AAV1E7G5_OLDCO|nr:OLC1v1016473C1 [Oldenlandia corymbosa var. corymbosa]
MENGFVLEPENGHITNGNRSKSSPETILTYKRRKRASEFEWPKSPGNSAAQIKEKSTKGLPDIDSNECSCQGQVAGNGSSFSIPVSGNFSRNYSRALVLEQMCNSMDVKGGLMEFIQDSLLLPTENGHISRSKDDEGRNCTSTSGPSVAGIQNAVRSMEGGMLNTSMNNADRRKVADLCKRTFCDVIMSEKFALLCNVLLENFHGIKADKLLDIGFINSRMKEGVYEKSPGRFLSDFQQVWIKLQKFGAEIVTLSKNLSEKSRASYREQFATENSDMHAKMEQSEACGIYKVCTCKQCGGKADGKDFLVCDSCEEMYHIFCIKPAVTEIPLRSWYCASCTAKGVASPHDNCVVCERLTTSRSLIHDEVDELSNTDTVMDLDESSTDFADDDIRSPAGNYCNICKSETRNGQKLRICGHDFCPHKFYHAKCLTSKQLDSYGPRWYCPSCLCRVCHADRDDDKIVLCDSCDYAYHIYCMEPPRTMIPKGKWFCSRCDAEIRSILKAKRAYENMQSNRGKRSGEEGKAFEKDLMSEKGKKHEEIKKSGGVDMLLNAAITLNYEENLATRRARSSHNLTC